MCGIVGYIGKKQAAPLIARGLQLLENRGYDSVGMVTSDVDGKASHNRYTGSPTNAIENEGLGTQDGVVGIGHTRWATHGEIATRNAHPHRVANTYVVHNGVIENYQELKVFLIGKGHVFKSETDSEVIPQLISFYEKESDLEYKETVKVALGKLEGAFAVGIFNSLYPELLIGATHGSPLLVGLADHGHYLASEGYAFVEETKEYIELPEDSVVYLSGSGYSIESLFDASEKLTPTASTLEFDISMLQKAGYSTFMEKEIMLQPESLTETLRGRIDNAGNVKLGGLEATDVRGALTNTNRLLFVACGTSWHAGCVGAQYIEACVGIPSEACYASEFAYQEPVINPGDIVVALSQSGETKDTRAALEYAKSKGAIILGVCNVVGSSIARMTQAGVYLHAGPEIGVASTKAFTSQVATLLMIAFWMKQERVGLTQDDKDILIKLKSAPTLFRELITDEFKSHCKEIGERYSDAEHCLFLGRGLNFPVALEGALKLKEISYIHAEGYPAAEMKHGPIALIDEKMPVIVIGTNPENVLYKKVVTNAQEVATRGGKVIAITGSNDVDLVEIAQDSIYVPMVPRLLEPLINVVPLQLLSYYAATARGCNVDQPRNLAKAVTVE